MSIQINPYQGTWNPIEKNQQSQLEKSSFLIHKINKLATYRVVSWNVGTTRDYSNMRFLYKEIKSGATFLDAYTKLIRNPPFHTSNDEKGERVELFQKAFKQFGNPDIICLQESWEMPSETLSTVLPSGYCYFRDPDQDGCIAWNASKFSKLNHAKLIYNYEYIPSINSSPDTIVLLKDNIHETIICVGSAHLRGFSLAYNNIFDEKLKKLELRKAEAGDNQTRYDLNTMNAIEADLYIFTGDFNVTSNHYPARLNIIESYGYVSDLNDTSPTIFDANLKEDDKGRPKPAKLDYFFVKEGKGSVVGIKSDALLGPLSDFNRPSDHLPIRAQITHLRADPNN
ncbi:MAG: hypothetical protein JJU12_07275 [Chlamydiales bacterium]|nr:hypothetical protein [Chlamydiales bacterium]